MNPLPGAGTAKFHRVEAVRGFVALYVAVAHTVYGQEACEPILRWLGGFEPVLRLGQEAVMAFFIISGFVIKWTSSAIESRADFGSFFWKRFARIYSVWIPGVALLAILASAEAGRLMVEPPGRFLGNALMLQDVPNIKPAVICDPLYGVSPLWTLHYEWWFYMVFPLALLVLKDTARQHHVVGVLAVVNSVVYVMYPNPLSRFLFYLAIWWIGVRAAVVLREKGCIHWTDMASSVIYVAISAVPLLLRGAWMWYKEVPFMLGRYPFLEVRHLLGAVVLVVLAFAWRRCGWVGFRWSMGLFVVFAPIAYALYFVHYNSLAHAKYFAFLQNQGLEILLYVVVTLAFCWLTEAVLYPWCRRLLEQRGWIVNARRPRVEAAQTRAGGESGALSAREVKLAVGGSQLAEKKKSAAVG